MLPIFRIVSVGGVLLAIVILLLALSPPGDARVHLARVGAPARGPLIDRNEHPEWRQFLILAALQRADEMARLRDLPDAPVREEVIAPPAIIAPAPIEAAPPSPKSENAAPAAVAALPAQPKKALADDEATGAFAAQPPDGDIPMEIGETSSTELPVMPHEEAPPVSKIRAQQNHQSQRMPPRPVYQARRVVTAVRTRPKPAPPPQYDIFQALFGHDNSGTPIRSPQ